MVLVNTILFFDVQWVPQRRISKEVQEYPSVKCDWGDCPCLLNLLSTVILLLCSHSINACLLTCALNSCWFNYMSAYNFFVHCLSAKYVEDSMLLVAHSYTHTHTRIFMPPSPFSLLHGWNIRWQSYIQKCKNDYVGLLLQITLYWMLFAYKIKMLRWINTIQGTCNNTDHVLTCA